MPRWNAQEPAHIATQYVSDGIRPCPLSPVLDPAMIQSPFARLKQFVSLLFWGKDANEDLAYWVRREMVQFGR